ncbi:class I SAM-dependent methyltransferase [Amycolatopsis sp. NPDC051045]|uniref:class I SAM-dependent methyltransferase n=1 Tax=Amycolatopsis sp. NPDC051045 TaxID=3156922 RepID=UPI003421701B
MIHLADLRAMAPGWGIAPIFVGQHHPGITTPGVSHTRTAEQGRRDALLAAQPADQAGFTSGAEADLTGPPLGVDVSAGMLRYAAARLPIVLGDAGALPIATGALPAVVAIMVHTDMPSYPAVLREAARVLAPGGVFVHIGVHPCFCGGFADRTNSRGWARSSMRAWCSSGSPKAARPRRRSSPGARESLTPKELTADLPLRLAMLPRWQAMHVARRRGSATTPARRPPARWMRRCAKAGSIWPSTNGGWWSSRPPGCGRT